MSAKGIRGVWTAAVAGSVLLLASVVLFLLLVPITLLPEDIAGEQPTGADDAMLGVPSLVLVVAIPFVLARFSGRGRWAARGALAALAGPAAMVVFFFTLIPSLFDSLLTLLTLGLGVIGAVAMRNPMPGSRVVAWRVVTVVATVALSVAFERADLILPSPPLDAAGVVLPPLMFPLLALSDTLAVARRDA